MAIELSTLTFTDKDDIVPTSGMVEIHNTGGTTNTFAGNDIINAANEEIINPFESRYSFINSAYTLNTGDGDDVITAIFNDLNNSEWADYAIYNRSAGIYTGDGNDIVTGILNQSGGSGGAGIYNDGLGNIETSDGNDIITGIDNTGLESNIGIYNKYSHITTGDGNDTITGTASGIGFRNNNAGRIETGKGEDIIIGSSIFGYGISNETGIRETGIIDTGDGNDIILGIGIDSFGIYNSGRIDTGDGDDLIISNGVIYNTGAINTGNGNDSIIAGEGFQLDRGGAMFLGEGEDYINGFGSGVYFGDSGNDILELMPGSYTIGISPGPIIFAKDGITMSTFGFEKLIAGSTSYDFTSLTQGQTIIVA
jgi:hypothetical protein